MRAGLPYVECIALLVRVVASSALLSADILILSLNGEGDSHDDGYPPD